MQPWQQRALLSLKPKGPVADMKVTSRKDKVLSEFLGSGHPVIQACSLTVSSKRVSKGWGERNQQSLNAQAHK